MPGCSPTTGAAGATGGIGDFILPIAILLIFVFLIIVPQRRRDKKVKDMLAAVKVGDRIKTIGGVYGRIIDLKDALVTIETGPDKCKIVFAKGAISTVENSDVEAEMK